MTGLRPITRSAGSAFTGSLTSLAAVVAAALICVTGCKTTYTPEDLRELEREQQEDLAAAEERAEHATSGKNSEALREQADEIVRETDR